jgi:peptide/nickel transport system substrate-binding protein
MGILFSPCSPQAGSPTTASPKQAAAASPKAKPAASSPAGSVAAKPQPGGVFNVLIKSKSNAFGFPPRIVGADKDFAPPFFDRLIRLGEDGKYKPALALSWDASADGKAITFKLRQGVTFHDGTPFNAQAVKANLDRLMPPKATVLSGITSVDVVDDDTVRLNLPAYNNLILYHLAINAATLLYSPEAVKKNGEDWATTHPVGTGPFLLKDYQPGASLTLVKNPQYWQKGLPYLEGIKISTVPDPMTQMMTIKAGQAHAIYDATAEAAAQLRDEGYSMQMAPGSLTAMNFDIRNSEIFSKPQIRQAIEYAIDKEAICSLPGKGLYIPVYQIVSSDSPDYSKACPPRRYNPPKARRLLAEAGYPGGFSFKVFVLETQWRDGWVAMQSYLDAVGIKMDINYVNIAGFNLIRAGGKIEKGAAAHHTNPNSSNTLYMLDTNWRSNSAAFPYIVKPAGIDPLIDKAKLSRDPAAVTKINQQIMKIIYDDQTIVPLWQHPRLTVVDKSVQDTGWFVYGDADNNEFGARAWLKK